MRLHYRITEEFLAKKNSQFSYRPKHLTSPARVEDPWWYLIIELQNSLTWVKTARTVRKNRLINNYSQRFQCFSTRDGMSRQQISKDSEYLNNTMNQLDFIDICRVFHPRKAEYMFKCTQNSHQNKACFIKQVSINWNYSEYILLSQEIY
jgi:hypothetical protein